MYVRYPETPYLLKLRDECRDAVQRGSVVFVPSVPAPDLVDAAAFADVGVIPYSGPNFDHRYACPNKLSQYMHAGLAVLSSRLEYVSGILEKYWCGVTFEPDQTESLHIAVKHLVEHRDEVRRMKRAAVEAARDEFNWQTQSRPCLEAIRELYERKARA